MWAQIDAIFYDQALAINYMVPPVVYAYNVEKVQNVMPGLMVVNTLNFPAFPLEGVSIAP